ncbi:hypothetical protein TNCV_1755131 [Trichonephila clavipes]|nr:hypothetical protein TNCV_1755131 [Trichonephila clavipes]
MSPFERAHANGVPWTFIQHFGLSETFIPIAMQLGIGEPWAYIASRRQRATGHENRMIVRSSLLLLMRSYQ